MKLIIDIPEENYDNKTLVDYFGCYSKVLDATIYNGAPIPDNATNEDVIKAMFPDGIKIDRSTAYAKQVTEDWLNSPYQKGGKG